MYPDGEDRETYYTYLEIPMDNYTVKANKMKNLFFGAEGEHDYHAWVMQYVLADLNKSLLFISTVEDSKISASFIKVCKIHSLI